MKKLFSILLVVILSITFVKAASIDFKIIDAKVVEKYGAIEVVDPVFSSNEITSSITFKEKNDYVIYNIILENNSGKTYKLVNVEDNNTSNNVSLSYEYEKEEVNPKDTVSLKVKVKYENLVKNIDSVQVKDFNVTLVLEDEKGNTQEIDINPKTGDNILLYVVLLLVAVAGIVLIIKKLKGGKLLVILPLLIAPLFIFGLQQFKINILFKDVEVIGTFDVFNIEIDSNNGDSTINRDIKYGDKVGSLPTPSKEGYTFVGWYDEKGNKVSEDTVITSEISLKAKYNPISYSITYNLDGGSVSNVDSYTIEDEITLNNPTKSGYTFAGWTEGEDDTLRTQITINKGTTGDKVFTAHFSTNQDTVYTVIHKQMNLNGEYEVTETEELHGATDTEVTPQTKNYEGFKIPAEQTVTIKGDGSTEVVYLYERKKFTLVVNNRDYVVTETADGSYYYGTNIILRAKERIGYTFTKWSNNETNSPLVFTLSSDLTIEPIYTPKDDTKYKVLHKTMDLDGQSYSLNEEMNETGTTDTEVTPAVKTLTGFTSPEAQTVNINADGSTVVEYLYTRNQHLLTINESDYVSTTTPSGNYYYETDITLTVLPRPGYTFVKWSNDETGNSTSFKMGDEDITISPIFTANTNTHYEVNHYLMKLDGQTYELLEGFSGTGTTDTQITPAVKTLTGFISPETQTVTINGDGSTVVDYYYAREEYTLTINDSDYVTTETPSGNYYYKTNITLTANERAGYTFAGWSNSETANPLTFELEGNMTIGPEYLPNTNTHYSVNHYLMKLDGQTYELLEGYSGTGTTDSPITPAVKTLTGFTSPEAQTVTIKGDGSTVVDYFYTRNQYTLTITNSDYVTTETPSGDYYYGTSITLTAKNRASYIFNGWTNGQTTNPLTFDLESDTTIGPDYTAIEYTVTFDSQGGYDVDSITRLENEAIGTLPVPTKEGHTFLGWYTSTEYTEQINSNTPVTADVIYYAKWIDKIKELETVFFIPGSCTFNGSSNLENVGLITSSSQDGCISTVNPSGADIDYTDSKFIDSHIALFSSDNFEKDFELGFTIDNMNTTGVHSQATIANSKLENSAENYPGFVIRKNSSNSIDLTSKFGSSKEYKANFTYTPGMELRVSRQDGIIYYSLNGETWQLLKDINDYKKRFNLTTWFGAFSQESDMEATGEDSYGSVDRYFNGTLSNIYIKMAPDLKYTVTFDAHGGAASFESKVVKHGKPVGELPTVEKENHYFDGWFTAETGGTQIDENEIIMAEKTFHAQFTENHTVTFNGNGATPSFSSKDVRHGSQIGTLPTIAKADYTFGGWYTDDANPTLVEETTVINKNESLIARWYADILKANISTADVVMNVGETHQIEITPITDLEEYTITSSDTSIATVDNTNVVTGVSDGIATITITGKISGTQITIDVLVGEIDTYTVRFVSDGETYETREVIPNRTVGDDMPDDPTKSGHTFVGWFIDEDINSPFDKDTIVSGDITVEAIWTEDNNVARIGNEYYPTLQAAFDAAPDGVETEVIILRDYDVTSSDNKGRPQINNTKNIVLNGGNYTLSCYNNNVVYNLGRLRVTSGTLECGYPTKGPIENSGTMIVDGGTIRNTNDRGAIYNTKGTVIINDGIITSTALERSVIQNIESSAKLTVNGGLIEQLNPDSVKGAVENQKSNATITINGGTIISNSTNDGVGAVQNVSGGKVTIGSKDNKHNTNTPILRGKKYGVYSPTAFNFYDGILEGITAGTNLSDSQINHEDNATLVDTETITIDSDTYKKLYYVVSE